MSARFAHPDPALRDAGGRADSNYSTERTPVTALLFAGKKTVLLPVIRLADDQSTTNDESVAKTERSIQE